MDCQALKFGVVAALLCFTYFFGSIKQSAIVVLTLFAVRC